MQVYQGFKGEKRGTSRQGKRKHLGRIKKFMTDFYIDYMGGAREEIEEELGGEIDGKPDVFKPKEFIIDRKNEGRRKKSWKRKCLKRRKSRPNFKGKEICKDKGGKKKARQSRA